jgi:prefoldin subunit 5
MKRTLSRIVVFAILCGAAATGGSLTARAQQTAAAPDVMTALLIEVRGLRAAMEQMASAGPRVQLALGRLQLQEQRIMNQVRRLDSVRGSLTAAQRDVETLGQHVKDMTESLGAGGLDPETQRQREAELRHTKAEWARKNAELQRFSSEEAMLAQDIDADQNRWTEINQRLEELERALGRR